MYVAKERRKPFRPSAAYKGLQKEAKQLQSLKEDDTDEKRQKFVPGQQFFDAETGEEISLTKANWSATEGRLDLDAHTILNMGTGKLDIRNRVALQRNLPVDSNYKEIIPTMTFHPIVKQFLATGPLTPMFNKNWNPRTNEIDFNSSDIETLDTIPSHSLETRISSSLPPITSTKSTTLTESQGSISSTFMFGSSSSKDGESTIQSYSTRKPSIHTPKSSSIRNTLLGPPDVLISGEWNSLLEKTYSELYTIAEQLEINKSLTLETPALGGLTNVRKLCRQLARLRVKQMQEVMMAVQDEMNREQLREQNELEYETKPELLKQMKLTNREERRKGKLYIDALQRDQEVIVMLS